MNRRSLMRRHRPLRYVRTSKPSLIIAANNFGLQPPRSKTTVTFRSPTTSRTARSSRGKVWPRRDRCSQAGGGVSSENDHPRCCTQGKPALLVPKKEKPRPNKRTWAPAYQLGRGEFDATACVVAPN